MTSSSTIFYNNIIGKKVISTEGKAIGRLKDLVADLGFLRPRIIAAVVSFPDGLKTIDFSAFQITQAKGGYLLACRDIKPINLHWIETVHIAGQLLNQKIIDMNRKKTILVYDLKIAIVDNKSIVVAVDAGLQGRLRQWGISSFVQKFLKLFDLSIPNQLVLWDNVEAINFGQTAVGI